MRRLRVELDETTAKRLDAVAPPRSRKRAQFLLEAVRRALDDLEEQRMEAAYRRQPDLDPPHFDPKCWEP